MLEVLADRTYRHLFAAQVVVLPGTGLATVALGLLAYDLASDNAAKVLGTAFTINMVVYVGTAPIAGAFVGHVNRRALLVALDLVRAGVAICLPFVTEIWQVSPLVKMTGQIRSRPSFTAMYEVRPVFHGCRSWLR